MEFNNILLQKLQTYQCHFCTLEYKLKENMQINGIDFTNDFFNSEF